MKQQKVEEYLRERLLINEINGIGIIQSTLDELVEVVKMLCNHKCIEQKALCATNYANIHYLTMEANLDAIIFAPMPVL